MSGAVQITGLFQIGWLPLRRLRLALSRPAVRLTPNLNEKLGPNPQTKLTVTAR